jgi:hypothetical protein
MANDTSIGDILFYVAAAIFFPGFVWLTWQASRHVIKPQEINRDPLTGQLPGRGVGLS